MSSILYGGDGTKELPPLNHEIVVVDGMKGSREHTSWTESVEASNVITSSIGSAIRRSVKYIYIFYNKEHHITSHGSTSKTTVIS